MKTNPRQLYIWYKPTPGQNYSMPFMRKMPNGLFCCTMHFYGDDYYGHNKSTGNLQYLRDVCSKMSDSQNYFVGDGNANPL